MEKLSLRFLAFAVVAVIAAVAGFTLDDLAALTGGAGVALVFGTGGQSFPLSTGNNNNPTLTQGSPTTWFLNSVPDRASTGPLAYVLPYLTLTISGTVVQPASGASAIYWDDLTGALIDTIDWTDAWFGSPVSSKYVVGRNLPVSEFIAGGYRYAMRRPPAIKTTAGTYPFKLTVNIPAASCRLGGLMKETSQLAALFQGSKVEITWSAASVLDGLSTGATFGTLTARLSARCYPTSNLILGTPIEQVLHQVTAGAGGTNNQVTINGFGRSSSLTNVQSKGGVLWLGELTDEGLQEGIFAAEDVNRFSMQWRGQQQIQHIETFVSDMLQAMPNDRPQTQPTIIVGGDSEFAGFPYSMSKSDEITTGSTDLDRTKLRIFPIVYGDNEVQLSDLQTADADKDYFMDVTGGFASGSHQVLAFYAKAFEKNMRDEWIKLVTDNGKGGLAAYVLQDRWAGAQFGQRIPTGRHVVPLDQYTYLPWQLA